MTNKHGVTYVTIGELRAFTRNLPDDAAISLGYLSDHAGFVNCYTTSFARRMEFHDYGIDSNGEHIGYEMRLETNAACDSGDPLK